MNERKKFDLQWRSMQVQGDVGVEGGHPGIPHSIAFAMRTIDRLIDLFILLSTRMIGAQPW